jgi:hypothetical protein
VSSDTGTYSARCMERVVACERLTIRPRVLGVVLDIDCQIYKSHMDGKKSGDVAVCDRWSGKSGGGISGHYTEKPGTKRKARKIRTRCQSNPDLPYHHPMRQALVKIYYSYLDPSHVGYRHSVHRTGHNSICERNHVTLALYLMRIIRYVCI